jgi:hypothetical protein
MMVRRRINGDAKPGIRFPISKPSDRVQTLFFTFLYWDAMKSGFLI